MKLYELIAASGYTKDFGKRFEVWVHTPYDEPECFQIDIENLYEFVRYAGCEVIYINSDCTATRSWIVVGVKIQ